ncbi:MAG: metallophosphoesterase family protein [Lachnospiraceae bacterium]|nr:metallophosphoesterase family protein [Lachnospiraceae bacterium]
MEAKIQIFIEMLFENIPYSEETFLAQEKIRKELNREYEKLLEKNAADFAFEQLLNQYRSLPSIAALAGYPKEEVQKWRTQSGVKKLVPLKKELSQQKRQIFFFSIFTSLALSYLFMSIWQRQLLMLSIPVTLVSLLLWYRYQRFEKKNCCKYFDMGAFLHLRALSDQYLKRSINSVFLFFAVTSVYFLSQLAFFWLGKSKSAEVMENVLASLYVMEFPLFFCVKNFLYLRLINRRIGLIDRDGYKKHLVGLCIFSILYWLLATTTAIVLQDKIHYIGNYFLFIAVLFSLCALLYNMTLRKKLTFQNITVNKKRIAAFTSLALAATLFLVLRKDTWYTQPYINAIPVVAHKSQEIAYNEETGVYTIIAKEEDFKVLHLTDIHLGGSLYSLRKDLKALHAVYKEISYTEPDLVVVTGDLTFPMGIMSMSLNNSAPVGQFAAFMRNIGIPWAFTYGNHDTESLATTSEEGLDSLYQSLSYKTSGTLLYPYVQPDISGRNNQLIEIRNRDGSLMQALFLIDSNTYTGEGLNVYDYIHDDQVDWYAEEVVRLNREEGRTIPSMVFFHIPLQEYRTAYELYEQGSNEVTYFFGENGEKMINKICCSDYLSKLFDTMVALGSTKAAFCGHDHYNNMSLEYKGIRLTYGMSIDYLAMPGIEQDTAQRGAELITLHADGTFDLVQIPLTSIDN